MCYIADFVHYFLPVFLSDQLFVPMTWVLPRYINCPSYNESMDLKKTSSASRIEFSVISNDIYYLHYDLYKYLCRISGKEEQSSSSTCRMVKSWISLKYTEWAYFQDNFFFLYNNISQKVGSEYIGADRGCAGLYPKRCDFKAFYSSLGAIYSFFPAIFFFFFSGSPPPLPDHSILLNKYPCLYRILFRRYRRILIQRVTRSESGPFIDSS